MVDEDTTETAAPSGVAVSSRTCELCWSQAFMESRVRGGSQVDHYDRLLDENDGKPGHI